MRSIKKSNSQTQELIKLVSKVLDEVHSYGNQIEPMNIKVSLLKENVTKLLDIIHGDESEGVITRLSLLESAIDNLENALESLKKDIEEEKDSEKQIKVAHINGRWAIYAALIAGALGLLASIATLIKG